MALVDANGNPLQREVLDAPQTSKVASLQHQWIQGQASGLTPSRAARILKDADAGDLLAQSELFDDMLDRDAHLAGEFSKRTGALQTLEWSVEPPQDASREEKKAAAWAEEILRDVVDDWESVLEAMMEAVGHGFAAIELEWRLDGAERIPMFHARPQTWLQLDRSRRELRLRDGSGDGALLWPMGWILHQPGRPKTGYIGRSGLLRPLVWPWIYRAYALSDFAEFLETFGLPIIMGKYFQGASEAEKSSLMRAVVALGHDARAIMPQEMQIEIAKITGSGGDSTPHLAMMEWAEKAMSKLILGGTLTTQADGASSTNALGNVHNEVRQDILKADAKRVAATLTRDLIYPMIAINRGSVDGLRRCPRLRFEIDDTEDLGVFADALPKLAQGGAKIPVSWVHERLKIPMATEGEEVFGAPSAPPPPPVPPAPPAPPVVAASQQLGAPAVTSDPTPVSAVTERMVAEGKPAMAALMAHVTGLVERAESLEQLRDQILASYGGLDAAALAQVMSAGFAVADLAGRFDVERGE